MQPAASAGPTLQVIWLSGQFQGVIKPTTPIGSLTTSEPFLIRSNSKLSSVSTIFSRCVSPTPTCESSAKPRGAPISRETAKRKIRAALLVDGDDPAKQIHPLRPARKSEGRERALGRGDGLVDVRLRAHRDFRKSVLGRGIDDVQKYSA